MVSITLLPLPLYTTPDTINDQTGSVKRQNNIQKPIDRFEHIEKLYNQDHLHERNPSLLSAYLVRSYGITTFAVHVQFLFFIWSNWVPLLECISFKKRFHVAVRLFSNTSQLTSKCGKNIQVEQEAIPECVTDVLTTFWRRLWSDLEQTRGNMTSICFI